MDAAVRAAFRVPEEGPASAARAPTRTGIGLPPSVFSGICKEKAIVADELPIGASVEGRSEVHGTAGGPGAEANGMGRTRLRGFELGGVRLVVEVPPGFAWDWPERWPRELACPPHDPEVYVGVRVGATSSPHCDSIAYSSEGVSFEIGRAGQDWVVAVHGREPFERVAHFDDSFREGEVVISPRVLSLGASGPEHPLQDPLADLIVMHRVVRTGGLVLQGSALVRNGSALVFLGAGAPPVDPPSPRPGAKLASQLLARDQVVLRREGHGIRVYGTPWRTGAGVGAPISAPLEALYVMKSSHTRISARQLESEGALSELLSHAFAPVHDSGIAERQLETARGVVERIPLLTLDSPRPAQERVVSFAWGQRQAALGFAPPGIH